MADVLLSVGVDYKPTYDAFKSGISNIINQINANPPKIKVKFDIQQSDRRALESQVAAIYSALLDPKKFKMPANTMQGVATGAKQAAQQVSAATANVSKLKAQLKEIDVTNANLNKTYSKLTNTMGNTTGYNSGDNARELALLKEKYIELQAARERLNHTEGMDDSAIQAEIANVHRLQDELNNLMDVSQNRLAMEKQVAAEIEAAEKAEAEAAKQAEREKAEAAKQAAKEKADAEKQAAKEAAAAEKERAKAEADAARQQKQALKDEESAVKKYMSTVNQMQSALTRYSGAKYSNKSAGAYSGIEGDLASLQDVYSQYTRGGVSLDAFQAKLAATNTSFAQNTQTIKANGDAVKSLGDRLGGLAAKFGSWLTVSQAIMFAVNTMRKMVTASIELDTAMTELKKVTDASDATYSRFLTDASSRASELGASLSDIVTASADFARLGYDIPQAEKLADAATVYKNVGDGIEDISQASESIISTMQAFGVNANDAMSIVDKFNEVGNNFAISSEGVGESLLRSAAAMHAAGSTLDETIALSAAANTVVQDPMKVGRIMPNGTVMCRKKIAISVKGRRRLRPRKDFAA